MNDINLMMEANRKSGFLGLLLNFAFPGLAYAYVGKWGLAVLMMMVIAPVILLFIFIAPPVGVVFWLLMLADGFAAVERYNKALAGRLIEAGREAEFESITTGGK